MNFLDLDINDISFVYYAEGEKIITRKDLPRPKASDSCATPSMEHSSSGEQ